MGWKGNSQTESAKSSVVDEKYLLLELSLLIGVSHPEAAVLRVFMVATAYL